MKSLDQLYSDGIMILSGGMPNIVSDELYLRFGMSIYKYGIIFTIAYLIYWTMSPGDFIEMLFSLIFAIAIYFLIIIPLNEMLVEIRIKDGGD